MRDSIEFYRHLALDLPLEGSEESHLEVTTPSGIRVMFDTEDVLRSFSDWEPPRGGGQRTVLAFSCDTPAEVDRLALTLTGLGGDIVVAPFDAPWGMRYATVADPDGNHLDLFAVLEGATA